METFSWMNSKLEVRDTGKYGKGIFAKEVIKKGATLTIFGGCIRSVLEEEKMGTLIYNESFQISDEFCLGVRKVEEFEDASFYNHSCDPNAGFKGQIFLVSMRKIRKNEEVCFDYAMVLSKARGAKFFKMKCKCGSKNCRGFVTDNDWKNKELQKKYDGFFQWYLQEKINKINK